MDSAKNELGIIPFKKFGRLRFKTCAESKLKRKRKKKPSFKCKV